MPNRGDTIVESQQFGNWGYTTYLDSESTRCAEVWWMEGGDRRCIDAEESEWIEMFEEGCDVENLGFDSFAAIWGEDNA